MKILITGSSGQLGKEIIDQKPLSIKILSPKKNELDLSNKKICQNYIDFHKPDFIINAGAFTNVDLAEKESDLCFAINAEAPLIFAESIKEYGGNLLQISSDYVFDGRKNSPYETKDIRNPISSYGYSKAKCEEMIEEILTPNNQLVILRTSWLLGPQGKNFLRTMLNLHQTKNKFKVVSDQIGVMSSTFDVAKICWEIIINWNLISKNHHIVHRTCQGVSSWFDIAVDIGDIATKYGILKNPSEVIPIKTKDYSTLAKRPMFSLLDCSGSNGLSNIVCKYWRHELENIISKIKDQQ
tara:strand:+ start:654 stop:1544 length:891 start_codon:yes stop_codon:yes gene_type:complete